LTPDSSRYADAQEYAQKWSVIAHEMDTGAYKNVSDLLKKKPELKITEESKQFVRDVLIENGYKDGQKIPDLTDEQVVETAWRYISSYEALTGKTFDFQRTDLPNAKARILNNLKKAGMIKGMCVVPIVASNRGTDLEYWSKLEEALKENGVPYVAPFFGSAHKETEKVLGYVEKMDTSLEPIVYITMAGRSNGLGPVVAGNTKNPVITCPVFKDGVDYQTNIHSSLQMPSKLPMATIIDPGNAALYAKRIMDTQR
ncbi:MAG: AIR carboxylase family protein, partial [Nanoarchaeota archaeon]